MKQKQTWLDVYLAKYKWYRKMKKGSWYKHQFTNDALDLSITFTGTWWARYNELNRYSIVIEQESWVG